MKFETYRERFVIERIDAGVYTVRENLGKSFTYSQMSRAAVKRWIDSCIIRGSLTR